MVRERVQNHSNKIYQQNQKYRNWKPRL